MNRACEPPSRSDRRVAAIPTRSAVVLEGPTDTIARLQITRGGTRSEVSLRYEKDGSAVPKQRPELGKLEGGYWYVDLGRASWPAIQKALPVLAKARGVVFDLRGYPANNHQVLQHIVRKPDDKVWAQFAYMIYPHQRSIAEWQTEMWKLTPAEPHLANVVFVTGPTAISDAESVLGCIEYEGLPIVGEASAGANGNIRPFDLPGGAKVVFTGMRVVRHDGSQQHILGVRPTTIVKPTIAGIAAGRDEVLERALEVAKSRAAKP